MLWALIYLLGLLATHFLILQGTLTETMALWVWFVVLLISSYSIGQSRAIRSATVNSAWMLSTALFIVLSGTMLLGIWSGGAVVLFALYLLLNGAVVFAMGHDMRRADWVAYGLYSVALGLVYPTWFVSAPFLAAAFILGVPLLLGSMRK